MERRDKMIRVLGIETSCDETAASVVALRDGGAARNPVQRRAQPDRGACGLRRRRAGDRGARPCRGAGRHRSRRRLPMPARRLPTSTRSPRPPDPGLVGGLIVGLMTAKAIARGGRQAAARGQPSRRPCADGAADRRARLSLSAAARLRRPHPDRAGARRRRLPALGDHDRRRAGRGLRQDGEAARPALSRRPECRARGAATAIPTRFAFPRPLKGAARPDFSFSGLKTAVRQAATAIAPLSDQDVADICASFQAAVADALADRVGRGAGALPRRISRHRRAGAGRRRRRRRQPDDPRGAARALCADARLPLHRAAARSCAPTMPR